MHRTKYRPLTLSNEQQSSPRSFFIITFVDRVGAVSKRSTLAVQTAGMSNAVTIDNNLVDVYELSKVKFGLTTLYSVKKVYYYSGCQVFAWCTSKSFGFRVGDDMVRIAITTCQKKFLYPKLVVLFLMTCFAECIPMYGIICSSIMKSLCQKENCVIEVFIMVFHLSEFSPKLSSVKNPVMKKFNLLSVF